MMNDSVRRTKIVATLGPATSTPEVIEGILKAGVNVVRLNFSHGSHELHLEKINIVREVAKRLGLLIGILADLQGPKIRVANFIEGKIQLEQGDEFILDAELDDDVGTQASVGIDYKELPEDVESDDVLLLDDGRISMRVKHVLGKKVVCEVISGGVLSNHKGINRQHGGLSANALTDKDRDDLVFAVQNEVDYIAISFPRNAEDIREAKRLIASEQVTHQPGVIAKIERTEAVDAIDDIIVASDGVMVARGDLAVEIGDAEVPLVQKEIIQRARALDKPVIVATQMMESMISANVPTRAEVSDVANAVLDNVDAVMLSAETAAGQYPIETVETMHRVCLRVEKRPLLPAGRHEIPSRFGRIDEAVAMATMYTANHLKIRAVVALTESGMSSLNMSRVRTAMPIYGLSRFPRSLGKMTLYRGVYPIYFDVVKCQREEINKAAVDVLLTHELLDQGDLVILTKGDHQGVGGGSNAMKILVVGEVVV